MTEKIYVVTLHKHEDLDSFYTEMTDKGFRLNMKRPSSRNTHYWMTEEQAIELRKDSRIWDVQLRPEEMGMVIRRTAENYDTYPVTGNFWKGDTQGSATVSVNDRQWGHLHCAGDTAQRRKGTYGLINQGATDEQVIDTVTVFNDGEHVDVIICDDPVSTDNEEWYSPTTNTTRYVQYDWYTELNTLVSSIDDDGQTTPSAPYPNYFKNDTNTESHGNHVCGTVAGQFYGWAREANIYSMQVLGNLSNTGTPVPPLLIYDYLRAFHRNKPDNPTTGFKNPTITNHSWGYGYDLTSENLLNHAAPIAIGEISSITYGGVTYSSVNANPSGWTMAGVEADFGIGANKMDIPADYAALRADVEDAIAEGIVIIGAAGNDNFHMVPDTDPNWDNFIKFTTLGNIFFNRGSSPVNAENVIKVGSLSNHHNFLRATYSNFGPAVDVFAPGNNILSAYDNTGLNDTKYTQGTGNYFYPIQGTSMASPQVAGVAACLATGKFRFTNADVLGYIQDHCVTGDMNWNVNGGDFADDTCQKGSPDRYLAAINPRPEFGQLTEQIGGRNTGMVFPRTRVSSTTADNPAGGLTYTLTITVVGGSTTNYTVVGSDRNGSVSGLDPTLEFNEGDTVYFNVNTPGHPVWLKDTAGTGSSSGNTGVLDSNVTNNGIENGTIVWNIPVGLAGGGTGPNGYFYYQCQNHGSMVSTIQVNPSAPTGEQGYYTAGTYTWVCPAGVSSVSAVCIGGGGAGNGTGWSGGGGGGGLGWKNNLSVVEGQSYIVEVGAAGVAGGANGGMSYFRTEGINVYGGGGKNDGSNPNEDNARGGVHAGDGGGDGGLGGAYSPGSGGPGYFGGGGGAGGYSGNGGDGGTNVPEWSIQVSAGTGGAAGGGWAIQGVVNTQSGCGGGVGVEGEGASGAAGVGVHDVSQSTSDSSMGGGGGSGGTSGGHSVAGTYGGGADGNGTAANGAVRIIWGNGRSFPNNAAAL